MSPISPKSHVLSPPTFHKYRLDQIYRQIANKGLGIIRFLRVINFIFGFINILYLMIWLEYNTLLAVEWLRQFLQFQAMFTVNRLYPWVWAALLTLTVMLYPFYPSILSGKPMFFGIWGKNFSLFCIYLFIYFICLLFK